MSPSLATVFSFIFCTALCPIVVRLLWRFEVLDRPSIRSSHDSPVPRGGGIAPAVAALAALGFSNVDLGEAVLVGLIVTTSGFCLVGLVEDVRGLRPVSRLTLQLTLACAGAPFFLEPATALRWTALVAAVFWIVAYSNAFNFMDGINGISAVQGIVAGITWFLTGRSAGVTSVSVLGGVCAAVSLGFLPFNFPKARVFLGDSGSYFFGALLSSVVVIGLRSGLPPEPMVAPLALYVADTATTLAKRAREGKNLFDSHREHVYQRLLDFGWPHVKVTALVLVVSATCSGLGLFASQAPWPLRVAADVAAVSVLAGYLKSPNFLVEGLKS